MRIRSIKPEFWRSQDVADLPRDIRLLWIGLWSYVDDNGVGIDDYRAIAADLFAFEDDPKEAREFVREGLATLSRALRIVRYELDGGSYIYVRNWKKHQKVDRPNQPRYPLPPTDEPTDQNTEPAGQSDTNGKRRGTLAAPSRDIHETPPSGTGEQGNRGTEEDPPTGGSWGRASSSHSRDRTATPEELNKTAHQPLAAKLVTEWHNDIDRPYTSQRIRQLRKATDDLLAEKGRSKEVQATLRDALTLWHTDSDVKGGAKALRWLYDKAVRNRAAAQRGNPPQLKAVSGGYKPWTNPTDMSVYEGDL